MKTLRHLLAARGWPALLAALGILHASLTRAAADAPQFAVPAPNSATTPVIGTLRVTIAMFVVLGAVLGAAWLTRRLRGVGAGTAGSMQVLAQVPLGARERAVLLRVGARQVLIGVAPGSVRTLHVLEEPTDPGPAIAPGATAPPGAAGDPQARPSFRSVLMRSLGR